MYVRGGDLDAADQPGPLVDGYVRLVAVHGLAPAVPGPARPLSQRMLADAISVASTSVPVRTMTSLASSGT